MWAVGALPGLRGPFSVLVYTSAKGVESMSFTGKCQGTISFQEVLGTPGDTNMLSTL